MESVPVLLMHSSLQPPYPRSRFLHPADTGQLLEKPGQTAAAEVH